MRWNVGTKISVGFGLAITIFAIVGIVSYRSTTQQVEAANWVAHTYAVQTQLTRLLGDFQDAETGLRGYVITGVESYLEPYTAGVTRVATDREQLAELTRDNPRQQARIAALAPFVEEKLSHLREVIEVRKTRDFAAARELVLTNRGKQAMDGIRSVLQEMRAEEETLLKQRMTEDQTRIAQTRATVVGGTLGAIVLAALAGLLITRNIARPLGDLTGVADRIALGDLSANVTPDARSDEVGMLARSFERMTQSLRAMAGVAERIAGGDLRSTVTPLSDKDIVGQAFVRMSGNLRQQIGGLIEAANVLGSAASEIVASTTQLASSASESATAVSETTTTVEEVRQTAQVTTNKALAVSESAQKVAQIAQGGRKSTTDVVDGMARIRKQMESIAASMVRLSEQTQTIGQIVSTVEDLAGQSNLLAVNAAIEAAKAGEHGKGFGVVAQEVKSLAEQSRQATERVRGILDEIQKATAAAVMATEQGSKTVEAGGTQTETAGEAIQMLAGSVTEAAQAATQIAASSQQQLVGMEQVAAAMENIKQASSQNVASARQLEVSARNLNELGQRFKQTVERYTV